MGFFFALKSMLLCLAFESGLHHMLLGLIDVNLDGVDETTVACVLRG